MNDSDNSKDNVFDKLKRLVIKDSLERVHSKGDKVRTIIVKDMSRMGNRDADEILKKIVEKATQYGLTVNLAKTHIQPLTKPFKFCKAKFTLTETGRVIVNGNRESVYRARHKFKALKRMYDKGERTFEDVRTSIQGSIAYFENYNDHNRVLKLRRLAFALFGFKLDNHHNMIKEDNTPCDMWFSNAFETNACPGW